MITNFSTLLTTGNEKKTLKTVKKILKGSNIEKVHSAMHKLRKMSKVTSNKLN